MIITKMGTLKEVEEYMQEQLKIIYNLKGFSVKGIQIKEKDNIYYLRIDVKF